MLQLNEEHYLFKGTIRACYQHPYHQDLCIKLPLKQDDERLDKHNRGLIHKENNYLEKVQKRLPSEHDVFFSKYLGDIDTTLGQGSVYQLVRDETTHEISKTLSYYLKNPAFQTELYRYQIRLSLQQLKENLGMYRVFMADMSFDNVCVQHLQSGQLRLVIVDRLGHRNFIPLFDYVTSYARLRTHQKFVRSGFELLANPN